MRRERGTVVLVVGPSGAGKDSILRQAQSIFATDPDVVFPRRVVTRKADVSAEDHDTVSDMDFSQNLAKGDYAVWWSAHGNGYGIQVSIDDDIKLGRTVIFNCSRAIIEELQLRYPKVVVVEIKVSPELLVDRIVARGRETHDEAVFRVSRTVPALPRGIVVIPIQNDGALEDAALTFCAAIRKLNHA